MRSREGWGGGWKFSAARRIKGVVRPQARPTRRKPRVQLRIEGEEGGGLEVSDIFAVGGWESWVERELLLRFAGCLGRLVV